MPDFTVKALEANLDFDQLPYWDVIIIGASPAGLAASLTTAHRALTTLVVEAKDRPGGQPQFLYSDKKGETSLRGIVTRVMIVDRAFAGLSTVCRTLT